jgi:hypothetical protein
VVLHGWECGMTWQGHVAQPAFWSLTSENACHMPIHVRPQRLAEWACAASGIWPGFPSSSFFFILWANPYLQFDTNLDWTWETTSEWQPSFMFVKLPQVTSFCP